MHISHRYRVSSSYLSERSSKTKCILHVGALLVLGPVSQVERNGFEGGPPPGGCGGRRQPHGEGWPELQASATVPRGNGRFLQDPVPGVLRAGRLHARQRVRVAPPAEHRPGVAECTAHPLGSMKDRLDSGRNAILTDGLGKGLAPIIRANRPRRLVLI